MAYKSNVYFRRAEREDLDTVVAWLDDPDFLHFLYGDPTRSPKQIRENIVSMLGRTVGQTLPGAIYLIIESPNDGPIGLLSLQNISWRNRSCSVDLYMGNKKYRVGLTAGLAWMRAIEYCFDELNLHRVSAYVYSFNTASWRICERSGAVRELTLREHVARDGKLYDMYCYAWLREDFDRLRESMKDQLPGKSLADMIAAWEKSAASPTEANP
ncbi:MAG: GNAT family N-acetyltransferase [Candidatus Hydrogenedentes bacterium]|nr:GNAT family N-acetyltransferase [Candidatus Hydrogenedentota bacterium]